MSNNVGKKVKRHRHCYDEFERVTVDRPSGMSRYCKHKLQISVGEYEVYTRLRVLKCDVPGCMSEKRVG